MHKNGNRIDGKGQAKTNIKYNQAHGHNDHSSQNVLMSQSTSADPGFGQSDKFNDSESLMGVNKKNGVGAEPDSSLNTQQKSSGFQFVSVVMEPNKKMAKSMKSRDKTKPLIDIDIIEKQIQFQSKLALYKRQNNIQCIVDLNEETGKKDSTPVHRGNLGLCYLDMSLVNLCGIPSLWINSYNYATSGVQTSALSSIADQTQVFEPFIKPFQKKLLKKQYKVYCLLRFHKIFENERYFGKSINYMHSTINQQIFQEYYCFQTESLKESNKYQSHQIKLLQKQFQEESLNPQSTDKKTCALHIIQGSVDVIQLDIPRANDQSYETAYFKLINSEAKILKQILNSQNIQQTDQNEWNLLWTSISLQQKPQIYEQLQDHQKINHFQNSTELTRKDRFAENIQQMKARFGYNNFDFVPETFSLPEEMGQFQNRHQQIKANNKKHNDYQDDNMWIYKPSQSSQGRGIYIINELNELQPTNDKSVVCKYISNPLLLNQHKFDLRIYVLLTSVDPLRIYVYNEGLARFASEPYDQKSAGKNLYAHLTNYSINKKSESFQQNKSLEERDHGNKWSLSDLQAHLEKMGIHMQPIWERIYDSIIKAIISVEHHLLAGTKRIQSTGARQGCFELFGFDIILDTNFKPYILEVNFSPSLSADSPLDYHIKSNLLVDTLNLVGIKKNPKRRGLQKNQGVQRFRAAAAGGNSGQANYLQMIQANQRAKGGDAPGDYRNFAKFLADGHVDQYFLERLSRISAKHRELVFETLDELQRNRTMNFTCIFPSAGCIQYDRFFEGGGRQSNQLVHRYLFTKNELYSLTKQISDYQKQFVKSNEVEELAVESEEAEQQEEESSPEQSPQKQHASSEKETEEAKEGDEQPEPNDEAVRPELEPANEEKQKIVVEDKVRVIPLSKVTLRQPNLVIEKPKQEPSDTTTSPQQDNEKTIESPSPNKVVEFDTSHLDSPLKNFEIQNHPEVPKNDNPLIVALKQASAKKQSELASERNQSRPQSPKHVELPQILSSESPAVVKQRDQRAAICESPGIQKKKALTKRSRNDQKTLTGSKSGTLKKAKMSTAGGKQSQTQQDVSTPKRPDESASKMEDVDTTSLKIDETARGTLTAARTSACDDKTTTQRRLEETQEALSSAVKESEAATQEQTDAGEKKKQKMVITGDDILIEYVNRVVKHLETILALYSEKNQQALERVDEVLPQQMRSTLEKFVLHKIWSSKLNSAQRAASIAERISLRHKEMVDRRAKILTGALKKANSEVTPTAIITELTTQNKNRDKIITRISSQKIEKMVKQSNIENQIDIVSILVEGQYNLPLFLQVQGGKTCVYGTLTSLKMFEKILKSDQVSAVQGGTFLPCQVESGPPEFSSEAKPEREQLLVPQIKGNSSNSKLVNNLAKGNYYQSAQTKKEGPVRALPEPSKRRLFNSGSTAGYNNIQNSAPSKEESNFSSLQAGTEQPQQRICRQLLGPMHQKNSQSFIYAENQTCDNDPKKLQAFDKRQRSYRNDSHMLNMSHKQPNQVQYFNMQRDLQAQIRLTHVGATQNPNYDGKTYLGEKLATFTQQTTPQVYQMPTVYQQSPSNSAINLERKQVQLMKDAHNQFNRSHQGDGFQHQFDSINQEGKRGGSQSLHTNTGQGPRLIHNTKTDLVNQSNNRLISFDSQVGGNNQSKQFLKKNCEINDGITLPKIQNPNEKMGGHISQKELKIKKTTN